MEGACSVRRSSDANAGETRKSGRRIACRVNAQNDERNVPGSASVAFPTPARELSTIWWCRRLTLQRQGTNQMPRSLLNYSAFLLYSELYEYNRYLLENAANENEYKFIINIFVSQSNVTWSDRL